ncbi:ABC transporter ATP-binding protein [Microvirga sp. W0021]|uniref:ABC transporter ATP-binding protein n=1 Tax=Hohaiivirga grylli TaxID=3133970 RepID=A0ABV0BHN4_9HYPH
MTDAAKLPVLDIKGLTIGYREKDNLTRVVHDVSFHINAGEVVALVGESGSGKTTTAQTIIGLLADNGQLEHGSVILNRTDISLWSQKQLASIRGAVVSLVPQDPGSSLNPVQTIGTQVSEIFRIHNRGSRQIIKAEVLALLERVGLSQPELRYNQYPHELSGGMRQRVLIAMAIALKPLLIIADEPTSALDVTVQRHILDLIDDLRKEVGTSILLVTHDLGVAADRADRIVVMRNGQIVEQGLTENILKSPASEYTHQLLTDAPSLTSDKKRISLSKQQPTHPAIDIVTVKNLSHTFPSHGAAQPFRAVDDISFSVRKGTTHAIVGESGSGKTTTLRAILGFLKPSQGDILIRGTNLSTLKGEELRQQRRHIQLVYQNPYSSLDPKQIIFRAIEEPLLNFTLFNTQERADRVYNMLQRVGLSPSTAERLPRALSGGQRQRVAIARALILEPDILVLDEAVSALDVTVQAQILELLGKLQQAYGLTYIFVSHDLAVVRQIADTVSVMHHGRQVEIGRVEDIFTNPQTDYTRELINAIPGKRRFNSVQDNFIAA